MSYETPHGSSQETSPNRHAIANSEQTATRSNAAPAGWDGDSSWWQQCDRWLVAYLTPMRVKRILYLGFGIIALSVFLSWHPWRHKSRPAPYTFIIPGRQAARVAPSLVPPTPAPASVAPAVAVPAGTPSVQPPATNMPVSAAPTPSAAPVTPPSPTASQLPAATSTPAAAPRRAPAYTPTFTPGAR